MNILHIANFRLFDSGDRFYATEVKLSNGFTRNGHNVLNYAYRDIPKNNNMFKTKKLGIKKMEEQLKHIVKDFFPDVIVLGHAELVHNDLLNDFRRIRPDIKIILWFIDPITEPKRFSYIHELQENLDAIFFGCNPSCVPSIDQHKCFYIPSMVDSSSEKFKNHEKQSFNYDLIYCATSRKYPERELFAKSIHNTLGSSLSIKSCGNMGQPSLFGIHYLNLLETSKMSIIYNKYNNVPLSCSDKITHYIGNGILTFCPKIPEFKTLFTEDEIVYYNDFEDLTQLSHIKPNSFFV